MTSDTDRLEQADCLGSLYISIGFRWEMQNISKSEFVEAGSKERINSIPSSEKKTHFIERYVCVHRSLAYYYIAIAHYFKPVSGLRSLQSKQICQSILDLSWFES